MTSSHDHVLDLVDARLHDAIDPDQAQMVDKHCEVCPICRVALAEAKKRYAALALLPQCEPGEQLLARIEQLIDEQTKTDAQRMDTFRAVELKRSRIRSVAKVAVGTFLTAAVIISSLQFYFANLSASAQDLQVFGAQQLFSGSESSLRVLVFDSERQQPVPDVPVTIELTSRRDRSGIQLASFRTDASGTGSPKFQIPADQQGDRELRVIAVTKHGTEQVAHAVQIVRSWQVMVTSDKPVYQPGQTIHLRSLALRQPDRHPVAGESGEFRLTDPKGNVVFHDKSVTTKFGIMSTDCPLADELIEGNYQIECRVGDTASSVTVEIKKYVLPKFQISAELDRSYYSPNDLLRGRIECKYFFGRPVIDAAVNVEIRTTDVTARILKTLVSKTDDNGRARFEYRLPDYMIGRESNFGDARLAMTLTITDSAGQSQSKDISCLLTNRPLRLEVICGSGKLVKGIENEIFLLATYVDGVPAANVHMAVSDFREELTTDQLGVCSVKLTPQLSAVDLTVTAHDDRGNALTKQVRFECDVATNAFDIRVENPVIDGGQTLRLVAFGQGSQPIFVDFIKDGQLYLTQSIEVANGKGTLAVDLPPELFGTVQICSYRFSEHGLPVGKTQVIHVRPADQLQIEIVADQEVYRPGETATLQFRIRDSKGHPAPGALSLAAVDEAVFSVLSQRPGMEQIVESLDEKLMTPIYAIYQWSPNLQREAPPATRNRFEQAIFSRSAGSAETAHSLTATSLPGKQQRIDEERQRGLRFVGRLWETFVVILVTVGLVLMIMSVSPRPLIRGIVTIFILGILFVWLSPASRLVTDSALKTTMSLRAESLAMVQDLKDHAEGPGEMTTAHVRQWFPETLFWRPQLITDDQGLAFIEIPLADSITNWRLTAAAINVKGELGAAKSSISVFQPFFVDLNLPVSLTREDEVTIQAVVYNYLDQPQTVALELADSDWFERMDAASREIEIPAKGVRSVGFPIRAKNIGRHELQIAARSGETRDIVRKSMEVVSDGRPVEQIVNGTLSAPAEIELQVPANAIQGSSRAIVKIYPSAVSQLVEGLDGIFQRPYGCFEQTSSTTYPNVLALDYLRRTGMKVRAVEVMARQYIHLGYQRLLTFEIPGGGFDWFGNSPANRLLTAYGLMEFEDMAKVHDVDPQLIRRTRKWLLDQRNSDGTWDQESHAMHDDPTLRGELADARFRATAYIAWAVYGSRPAESDADSTIRFLTAKLPEEIGSTYDLALLCNALLAIERANERAAPYLTRLYDLRQTSTDGKLVWWEQRQDQRTIFYGSHISGDIETTSLCATAFLSAQMGTNRMGPQYRAVAHQGLNWISARRDRNGTWPTTQATVLALKALLAGTDRPVNDQSDRRISIELDGRIVNELSIPAWQFDVVKQVELNNEMTRGTHQLRIVDRSGAAPGFQVDFRSYVPGRDSPELERPLSIELTYDRSELAIDDTVTAQAIVRNGSAKAIPMVVLDLPIPAGFSVEEASIWRLRGERDVAKVQTTPRNIIVYLRSLDATKLILKYRLRATMPIRTTTSAAVAYEYYSPDNRAESVPDHLVVISNR